VLSKLRRLITPVLCLLVLGLLGRWLYYRQQNVVASYAFVRSAVVVVGSPLDAQIASVEVEPGQRVAEGVVLVRFNQLRERAEVERARAQWVEASVHVEVERKAVAALFRQAKVVEEETEARLGVQKAEARAADVAAQLAEAQERRTIDLRAAGIAPETEAEVASARRQEAFENALRAQGQLIVATSELGRAGVESARAEAGLARLQLLEASASTALATLKMAEAALELTLVRSARAGVVTRRLVEPGAAVAVGGPLLEVWHDDSTRIEAWIDESEYAALAVGGRALTMLTGLGDTVFPGRIEWLGVVTEAELREASFSLPLARMLAKSRWVRARIQLDQVDGRMLPGLTAAVSIPRSQPQPVPARDEALPPRRSPEVSLVEPAP
jgi:multidrug resistance efflux pump